MQQPPAGSIRLSIRERISQILPRLYLKFDSAPTGGLESQLLLFEAGTGYHLVP